MADYYPLIARAIAGLDPSAPGEARRALYERARSALIAQLRSVDPPLSESEITRERLSLEEAVRKVESEAAQRARDARAGGDATRSAGPRAGDAFRAATRPSGVRPGDAAPSQSLSAQTPSIQTPPSAPSSQNPPPRPRSTPTSPRNLRADPPPIPSRQLPQDLDQDAPPLPPRERPGAARRGADNGSVSSAPGIRGFRDIAADADDLGRAAAQANRAARKTYANVPPSSTEFDRLDPGLNDHDGPDSPYSYDEPVDEAERYAPSASRPRLAQDRDKKRVRTGFAFPYKIVSAIGIVLILAGAGILWGKPALNAVSSMFKSSTQVAEAPKDTSAPATKPKIPDRVGQPSSTDQVAPVAQRVVLYDEDPSDPKGKQYVGTVVWRTEPVKAGNGQPADIAVRADIDIPDRKFKMTMSFRRNTDASLPASHTAELTFILPPDFDGGGVSNVPGILMKSNEQARGTPLAGLAVKVTDGFFLVGLSNVDSDRDRNIQLLKERSWFDVPLVYVNQRRAIIAIEKGPPGERAFNEAFAAWGE
ncbi:MAG TPA: hypothetical protein VMU69_30005 [Bradyrhizobium sp.]|nr:hypothetical protein [Bradyrhizobium sp.]